MPPAAQKLRSRRIHTANTCCRELETRRSAQKSATQYAAINCMRIYQNRTAASGEQKPPEKNRWHPPEGKNRLTTMCRKSVEASDKTGKANYRDRMQEARASQKSTHLHKIGQRIELQNPNGRENQAEMKKQVSCIKYHASCLKSEKKNSRGKSEPDTSSNQAVSGCRCTFLLLIFVTHSINEIGYITFKKEKNGKNPHPPSLFFSKTA